MKLVGVPTAILTDEESGQMRIQASVVAGEDKRSITWKGRNRSVFPISDDDKGQSAFERYADVVETAISDNESGTQVRPIVMVGRKGDAEQQARNMTVRVALRIEERFRDRIDVTLGTFGDAISETKASVAPLPFTVEEAYSEYLTHLWGQFLSESDPVEQDRLSGLLDEEEMSASNVLIAYRGSPEKLATLQKWRPDEKVYEPYYESLLQRAAAGEPAAIGTLEMEMRHAALRLFVEYGQLPQGAKAESPFVLMTNPDILAQLPFRAGDRMRHIFALEIRRLFGIPGNISVKSRHADEKSPPFGDLTVVALADAADRITGEQPDDVRLRIPDIP